MLKKLAGITVCLLGLGPAGLSAQAPLHLSMAEMPGEDDSPDIRLVTPASGYLILLHVSGRSVRVMFPGRPSASAELAAGEYDLDRLNADRPWGFGRGGTIVAAWSATPIRTRELVRYGHWAVSDLNRDDFKADPVHATIHLARRLGATEEVLTVSVDYRSAVSGAYHASHQPGIIGGDDLTWRAYQNFARLQRLCPSGTRDVTGAGETCSSPSTARRTPRRSAPLPEYQPPDPPNRPIYAPAPVARPLPAAEPRPSTPPPPSGGSHRKPL